MGLPITLTIQSGCAVTSAFSIDAPWRSLVVLVPSLDATDVHLDFASASGGGWAPLVRADGSGVTWSIYSGAGPATAVVPVVATNWARLSTVTTQTGVRSFQVLTVTR